MQADGASRRPLTGWGRTAPTVATVRAAAAEDELVDAAADAPPRGVIARGLGRSYNDAAQNAGGLVVELTRHRRPFDFDERRGVAHVAAGVSIGELLRTLLPRGWFPPVTPGTQHVTIGGAIAADVHGKNHHHDGSFGCFVRRLRLWTPALGVVEVTHEHDPDVFWATIGGMGLTGFVIDAWVEMRPVETSRMVVDTDRAGDLEQAMSLMTDRDDDYEYSVAWIDCQARGRHMGRSVLTRARHARLDDLPRAERHAPLSLGRAKAVPAPPWVPSGLMNQFAIRGFNELWYRKAPKSERGRIVGYEPFFYPLDMVEGWNRLYGRRGFVQYQFVVPFGAEDVVRRSVEALSASRTASFLGVLKRFGPGTPGHLSFPSPGWTLALDIPVGRDALAPLLDRIDDDVVAAGGRCYLAKDARLRPELLPAMYPRIDEWRAVQLRLDPGGTMRSDLARRLDLLATGERS